MMMKLGKAFSDNVIIEHTTRTLIPKDRGPTWWFGAGRALFFATLLFLAFFILIWRLFNLTIIRGHEYRVLADGNRTRELIRHAPRGILRDRTGKPLVENIPSYRLLMPCEGNTAGTCMTRLSKEEAAQLETKGLPEGAFLEVDYARRYPYGEEVAHVIGYTGELSEAELADQYYAIRHYRRGDRVGRAGAEAVYEGKLRGRDGRELVEIDATGKSIRTLGRESEIAGDDVTLSVDIGLAQVARDAFPPGFAGAVIVAKPATGEILVLYSSPSYNPNKFSLGMTEEEYQQVLNDPDRPLFSRAIGGAYPPGSIFKIVTALAGLEEKAITKDTIVEDIGVLKIGVFEFPNWYFIQYGKTEGAVNLVKAMKRSNDIYFYKVGEWLGITKLAVWARKVGIGAPLGIEVSGEASGLMPDPLWKNLRFDTKEDKEKRNNQWYLGDTYHVAIGQGYLLTTPIQVNAWTNVIASSGKLCKPTIQKISNFKFQISNCKNIGIQKETIALISEGMKQACQSGGTGWPLFNFKVKSAKSKVQRERSVATDTSTLRSSLDTPDTFVPVACKTGTAEFGDPKDRTHAWFTAFAPLKVPGSDLEKPQTKTQPDTQVLSGEPEISVTVLVEAGGEGSSVAAPIARKILQDWFSR